MWKIVNLLLIPLCLFSEEIEVCLPTRSPLKALYLSRVHSDASVSDWRYAEELREVIEFDLNTGGFCSVPSISEDLEEKLHWPDIRSHFDLAGWKKAGAPYLLTLQVIQGHLSAIAFDIEKGSSKKYPDIALSGRLEQDRTLLHRLADTLHKDLFGIEGIASLKILYTLRTHDLVDLERRSEIWVSDFDNANARQVTFKNGYCVSPMFFPHSNSEFFYVSFQQGQSKIYRSSLQQKEEALFISLRGNQILPSISSQGTHLAFITDIAGRPDLFLQMLDGEAKPLGKPRQLFSAARATQASPTFSPDGKQIAFVSDKDGPPRIYVLDVHPKKLEKPRPRLLTRRNRENTSPAWSPDGTKIAYSAKTEDIRQIWIYDFETEEEIQLTTGPEMKENPVWAPDSLHLLYNTESDETCELYLINLHHPESVQISKGSGQKRFPYWGTRQ